MPEGPADGDPDETVLWEGTATGASGIPFAAALDVPAGTAVLRVEQGGLTGSAAMLRITAPCGTFETQSVSLGVAGGGRVWSCSEPEPGKGRLTVEAHGAWQLSLRVVAVSS